MVEAAQKTPTPFEDLPTLTKAQLKESGIPAGGCIISKMCGKYGPYRYHVKKVKGNQTWTYLGKGGKGGTKHERGLVSARLAKAQEV